MSTAKAKPPRYVSPYNWQQLVQDDNGRFSYLHGNTVKSRFGIDVSEHQGAIDWQAVANDGVEFALIRLGNRGATEGLLYLDDYFEDNISGAQQAGILVGVYFFSQAITEAEAREEAEFVLKHLKGHRLDYPVVFDHEKVFGMEARSDHLTGEQISRCTETFLEIIREAGYDTMVYGNKSDLYRLSPYLLNRYGVWLAEYDAAHPTMEHDLAIWQFTSNGSVDGISTRTDLNIHFIAP
jgi:GH25 family lysozyme M1 (1,4-beta-N-acetylmuramidase)